MQEKREGVKSWITDHWVGALKWQDLCEYLPTVVWGGINYEPVAGFWTPKTQWCVRATISSGPNQWKGYSGTSHRGKFNDGYSTLVRVPMLTHCWKPLQWIHRHLNWTLEQLKKIARPDVFHLLGEVLPAGCTVGRSIHLKKLQNLIIFHVLQSN